MKKLFLLICLLPFALLLFSGEQQRVAYKPELFYLGGIQINEADNLSWMNMLKQADMNTIEVTVYAEQGEWDSDSLRFDEKNEKVLSEIRTAKKAGINVVLILRVALDYSFMRNRFMWHGMILPKNEQLLANWFDRYEAFAMKWATIAAEEQVDVFSIGSEMNALSSTFTVWSIPPLYAYYNDIEAQNRSERRALKYESILKKEDYWVWGYDNYPSLKTYLEDRIQYNYTWGQQATFAGKKNRLSLMNQRRKQSLMAWKKLIKQVRTVYKGQLTYAANFDNYMEVAFWDDLDFIGINAYFGLRNANRKVEDATELKESLERGWKNVFYEIDAFRTTYGLKDKPMIFTELGYVNRENTTLAPWAGFGYSIVGTNKNERVIVWKREKEDLEERKFAMDALYKVVKQQQINLEGILYWKLTTHDYHLPHEPFALHLTPNAKDSLQTSLAQFARLDD
ncbi:glycoside hydrolase family 113 [Aureispira anguillae]|uniref:Glycoside hydrolase family 42 N-terminal domain-containing protein n=1 Tax=Aureispira anguillae TaxID=2864201 RepID=A0A915YI62_9BACT|nr:hypothetical protein [Aureispira anguillae]BDS13633.1 hypothetical protein AsAng_0043720 [Aureispira anguillae]